MEELTRNQKEYKLQVHIVKQHVKYFPHVCLTHIPNRPSSAADGHFKKEMGVKKGVSDLCLWWSYPYPAWAFIIRAWIERLLGFTFATMHNGVVELKVDADIDAEQNKFLSQIYGMGGKQGVAKSWRQYYKLLCSWGIKPKEPCTVFEEPDYRSIEEKFHDAKNRSFDFYRPNRDKL